ncbi:YesK family protein [uncultured Brevibacillus sp.]|uniref:YesK family protein n=1 Tax=uncultured Brevibacillus sp. TaxID=169970 RepID=UPI0025976E63|nr:YesK family protein [uncultured Brevibacillus sp.]
MEGFEIFIYICLGVTLLFAISSIILRRIFPEKNGKYLGIGFAGLLIISIVIIIISFFVGGWSGMGYGLIGISIFIGTIFGGILNIVIKYFFDRSNN